MALLDHYKQFAANYDKFYDRFVVDGVIKPIVESAHISPEDLVLEMGAGTALPLLRVKRYVQSKREYIAVDPCQAMLDQAVKKCDGLVTYCMDAEQFSNVDISYDIMIMHMSFHHFQHQMREIFPKFARQLNAGGRVVLTQSMSRWPGVAAELNTHRMSAESIMSEFESCGLRAQASVHHYCLQFPVEEYADMLRGRFVSWITNCSDAQIDKTIANLKVVDGFIRFKNEYFLVVAEKSLG